MAVDTFGGRVHVEWDPQAPVTPLGQLPFFIKYLRLGGLFDPWMADCPLRYTSPNSPRARDVLGTLLLSVLVGHRRYAHITSLRGDGVNPALLGMTKVVSKDAVRRALAKIDESAGTAWLERHLDYCVGPPLSEPWILDVDTTIKPLYGHQEGPELGYNPNKPGRPSHVYHSYMIGELRLALAVEVQAGNHHASKHAAHGLWSLLARLGRERRPALLRGDIGWASEANMRRAEQEPVQAARDAQRQAPLGAGDGRARLGAGRPGLGRQGSRAAAHGLEPGRAGWWCSCAGAWRAISRWRSATPASCACASSRSSAKASVRFTSSPRW